MINYTHFKFPGRQQQTFAPGSDIACIARDRLASGIPDEIQHDLSIVAKLDAEPIPPAAAKREKVSPLVIHPCFASYWKGLVGFTNFPHRDLTGRGLI